MSYISAIEILYYSDCWYWQTNTPAAEVLYSAVGEWAQLDQDSTVLDVCCGTGTIGISLAKVRRLLLQIHKNRSNEQSNNKKIFGVNREWRRWLA